MPLLWKFVEVEPSGAERGHTRHVSARRPEGLVVVSVTGRSWLCYSGSAPPNFQSQDSQLMANLQWANCGQSKRGFSESLLARTSVIQYCYYECFVVAKSIKRLYNI